jgi:hypothetical protein
MRKLASAAVVAALTTGLAIVGTGPTASAATTPGATISVIPSVTAPYHGSVTVRPRVKAKGQAVIAKSSLTVKRGTKTVARSATAPRLSAGTYTVTTTATFRPYTVVTSKKTVKERVLSVPQGTAVDVSCRITWADLNSAYYADFSASCKSSRFDGTYDGEGFLLADTDDQGNILGWSGSLNYGGWTITEDTDPYTLIGQTFQDTISAEEDLYKTQSHVVTTTTRKYSAARSTSRHQKLVVRAGVKPRTCATYADFKRVRYDSDNPSLYGSSSSQVRQILHSSGTRTSFSDYGDYTIEFRHYKTCTKGDDLSVGFLSGFAYAKSYWS